MKFASASIALLLLLVAGFDLRAAGPDETYLEAYQLIQEADQLVGTSQPDLARQRYERARENLKRLQTSYPNYSKAAVAFRLEYLEDKLKGIPASAQASQPAAPAPRRPATGLGALAELTNRVSQLESDNALLQAKLQEALAPRPAAVDPAEFANAQERVKKLEKEKELLRLDLDKALAKQPNAGEAAQLGQARAELEATNKKLIENIASLTELTRENNDLKKQLAAKPAPAPETKPEPEKSESARVKELEKERDSLLEKLNHSNKELYDVKARGQAAQFQTLTNQLSNLRARLEVFEARKVPFTKEELALMDKSPKLATAPETKPAAKKARELPPGAGILIGDAERAFAARRFTEAEEKYKQVVKLDDENPVSLANLAAIQLELQKQDEAEANIKKAMQVAPDDAYPLGLMGMLRFQQGKFEEALDVLSRSAQLDPKNPETQNYLGITLSQQGQREAAETALRKAIVINPNYAGAHHNLAVIYATQKPPFLELARFHYNKALALGQPANPELEKQLK